MIRSALTRLAKGSLIYGVGSILQRFLGLLLLPLYTRALSTEDYGVVALISLATVAVGGLFNLGTGNSMGILYYREQDLTRRFNIIWTNIVLMALNGVWLYAALYLAAPLLSSLMFQTDRYADFIRLALLGVVFTTISDPWLAYLRMEERAKRYVVITLTSSLITIGLSIWLVLVQRMGVTGVLLAGALGQALQLLICWAVIGRRLPFGIDRTLFMPLVRIGFPSIFGLFAFLLIDYADRQMIERMLGLNALGVYSVGYSFGMVMMIAVGAFCTAWPPFFISYVNKPEEARTVFGRVMSYYLLGFGALTLLFFFVAKPVVHLMTAAPFHEAFVVVGLLAAAYALKGCYLIALPGVYFAHKLHRQTVVEWVAALVNIALNLWLIPIYGIFGAALATFASYLCLPVLAYFVSRRYLAVDYQWGRLVAGASALVVSCLLVERVSVWLDTSLVGTLAVNSLVLLTFAFVAYRFLLTGSERELIRARFQALEA